MRLMMKADTIRTNWYPCSKMTLKLLADCNRPAMTISAHISNRKFSSFPFLSSGGSISPPPDDQMTVDGSRLVSKRCLQNGGSLL